MRRANTSPETATSEMEHKKIGIIEGLLITTLLLNFNASFIHEKIGTMSLKKTWKIPMGAKLLLPSFSWYYLKNGNLKSQHHESGAKKIPMLHK